MSYPQGCSDRGLGPGRKAIGNGGALNKQVPRGGRCFGGLPGRDRDEPRRPGSSFRVSVARPPAGAGWLHEVKHGGYRVVGQFE